VQRVASRILVSPTDLTKHMACRHVTALDLGLVEGALRSPAVVDDQLELIFALGVAHEKNYLESLRATGLSIVEVPSTESAARREAEDATVLAMRSGVDVIYQAAFSDGSWAGQADFLLRVEVPSRLGSWSYEVADTKLARRLKVPALLQMAFYADQLGRLQGAEPARLFVVTGDGQSHGWRLLDVASLARRARRRLEDAVENRPPTEPVPVTYCGQCRWLPRCAAHWKRVDDLSLVAFMRSDHRHTLIDAGISTMALLGGSGPEDLPRAIGSSSRERLVAQARQQLDERHTGAPSFTLLAPEAARGLLRLPPPSEGDLYLDFEGDPFAEGGEGREYLAGIGDRRDGFEAIWAHDRTEERRLTEQLVDLLLEQWRRYPEMHVYHYAPYETTALKRLTSRYGVREVELDRLLRGERFIDLYAVVRQGVRISKASYSIKKMEAFYWGHVRSENEDVADAMSSVIEYERWLVEQDQASLDRIEAYNRDDVRSTHDLHGWLEGRRAELEEPYGPLPRPDEVPPEPEKPLSADEIAEIDLARRLKDHGQELLANLVQWHP
jgi:predicted RecB family nuclease